MLHPTHRQLNRRFPRNTMLARLFHHVSASSIQLVLFDCLGSQMACKMRKWLAGSLLLAIAGCAMLDRPVPSASPTGLSWLTNWGGQPLITAEPFDINRISPPFKPGAVVADSLLEVTVWDLFEPGKPHTFPVRVTAANMIDVPLVGEMPIQENTLPDIEATIAEAYRSREFLVHPKVLVRNLEAPRLRIFVTGAVNRPGFVELSRNDPTLFAALVSAGGLRKGAGTHVSVSQAELPAVAKSGAVPPIAETSVAVPAANASSATSISQSLQTGSSSSAPQTKPAEGQREKVAGPAIQQTSATGAPPRANSSDVVSVAIPAAASTAPVTGPDGRTPTNLVKAAPAGTARSGRPSAQVNASPHVKWYDLSLDSDRQLLMQLKLSDGDTVTVKAATLPIRIAGAVARPGNYELPVGRALNAFQALELAGGVTVSDAPLTVMLFRPASDGRSSQRWFLNVESINKRTPSTPAVEPGDMIHVEPSTGSAIKQAFGHLLNR